MYGNQGNCCVACNSELCTIHLGKRNKILAGLCYGCETLCKQLCFAKRLKVRSVCPDLVFINCAIFSSIGRFLSRLRLMLPPPLFAMDNSVTHSSDVLVCGTLTIGLTGSRNLALGTVTSPRDGVGVHTPCNEPTEMPKFPPSTLRFMEKLFADRNSSRKSLNVSFDRLA